MPPKKPDLSHISESLRPIARSIDDLTSDPANARTHDRKNIDAIKSSLKRFGQRKPIVIRRKGSIVEAGNGTLEAVRELAQEDPRWKMIAVVDEDDDPVTAAAFAIADNRSAELASWDEDALGKLLKAIEEDGQIDPKMLGFDDAEIAELIHRIEMDGKTETGEVPAPPDDPVTQAGDLWILGKHRLLCGDSASQKDVDRLLDGRRIQLVNTDPPYNVKVEPRSNNAIAAGVSSFDQTSHEHHHQKFDAARRGGKVKPTDRKMRAKDRPLVNDFVSEDEFDRLLRAWFGNIARVLEPGRSFYIWGGYANCANYPPALKACGLYFSQAIIWHKQHPVLTRKDFMGDHEWCFYGWREGKAHVFLGPNNVPDVWPIKKVNPASMVHLTEKPVDLAARALEYSSRAGENVLDLFGGSGSTLIACEQMERRAHLMEIDPAYCDVIVERWEKFTGRKAERRSNGEEAEEAESATAAG